MLTYHKPKIPDACPICNVLLRSLDLEVYNRVSICADCEMHFLQRFKPLWDEGWRPNPRQIEERLKERTKEPFFFVHL